LDSNGFGGAAVIEVDMRIFSVVDGYGGGDGAGSGTMADGRWLRK